uniref:ARAD1C14894p n=1 Tax=Blastobotrys adeninivorans TaxID=409370 RepID=A0A060T0Q7_BLAAD
MPKRKFSRSLFGCQTCKARKVKCDEEKPVCAKCKRLGAQCVYKKVRWANDSGIPGQVPSQSPGPSTSPGTPTSEPPSEASLELDQIDDPPVPLPPEEFPAYPVAPHELYLLYFWMKHTAKSLSSESTKSMSYNHSLQLAFQHRFLLDSMFLLTCAHLNHLRPCQYYQQLMGHYHSGTVAGLQQAIDQGITRQNGEAAAIASSLFSLYTMTTDVDSDFGPTSLSTLRIFKGTSRIYSTLGQWWGETLFAKLNLVKFDSLPYDEVYVDRLFKAINQVYSTQYLDSLDQDIFHESILKLGRIKRRLDDEPGANHLRFYTEWLMRLNPEFVQRMSHMDPAALFILCEFCRLLAAGKQWFCGNYAVKQFWNTRSKLPAYLHPYIEPDPGFMSP